MYHYRRVWGPYFLLFLIYICGIGYFSVSSAEDYLLAPGDKISIYVYGEGELSFNELDIPKNGMISFPLIGEIKVAGFTQQHIADKISAGLINGYLVDPQVTVSVVSYRPIFISGAVNSPGQHGFVVNMDIEKAIAVAQGFARNANEEEITILREVNNISQEITVNMTTKIFPGDVISVGAIPEDELRKEMLENKDYIYLYGEIKRPGRYEYTSDLSVEKAIVLAGGFNNRASKRKINVSRGTPSVVTKKVSLDYPVLPGDVITIGASLF